MVYSKWIEGAEESDTLEALLALRRAVLIEEGGLSFAPCEPEDKEAMQLGVFDNDGLCGAGRLCALGGGDFLIGRIAIAKEKRGKGYGDLLVRLLVRRAFDSGGRAVYVEAVTRAQGFYEKLGFVPIGNAYMKDGQNHVKMVRNEDVSGRCGQSKK